MKKNFHKHDKAAFFGTRKHPIRYLFSYFYADLLISFIPRTGLAEANDPVAKSEKSVVLTDTDVGSGMELGPALTHENVTTLASLSVALLRSQSFGFAVTTVSSATHTFFMGKQLNIDKHCLFLHFYKGAIAFLNVPQSEFHRFQDGFRPYPLLFAFGLGNDE